MRIILITSILLNFIFPCYSQKSQPIPITGTYEMGLQVCYNPASGEISGILSFDNMANKLGVQISCNQYFTGYHQPSDHIDEFSVRSRYPDDTTKETLTIGKLKISNKSVYIQLDEPNSCQNLIDLKNGWDFDSQKHEDFIACRIIKVKKAFFYTGPDDLTKQKTYIVEGYPILIRSVKSGWLNIAYLNNKGIIRNGWIKQETIRTGMPL
ncbi:MAG: hypothetical protein JWR54_2877 [Mucilaginibacter sp.]|nr:hypothetical protein [Mucilaginibacter sp.]